MTSNATHTVHDVGTLVMCELLDQRFGDGSIYLLGGEQHAIFDRGRSLGLISDDGQITASGRRLLDRWMD